MSLDANSLAPLFELSREAVVALRDGRVLFANPAARALFPMRAGDEAATHLPEHVLTDAADRFVTSGDVAGQPADITVVRQEDVTLLSIVPSRPAPAAPLPDRALAEMGESLMTQRLALDNLTRLAGLEQDKRLRRYTSVTYQSFYRLKRLQEHISLASRLAQKAIPFSPLLVHLEELFSQLCGTVASLAADRGVSLVYEATGPCPAAADPQLMETLLLNLLSNSLLHASAGDRVRVTLSPLGRRSILSVDDPGTGMAPERLAGLFAGESEPELTDAAAGAGLGMMLVRGIAELHGGNVLAESREGSGTRIRVSLPRPTAEEAARLRQSDQARIDGMNAVLTELSVVLDKSFYTHKYFD